MECTHEIVWVVETEFPVLLMIVFSQSDTSRSLTATGRVQVGWEQRGPSTPTTSRNSPWK